MNRVTPPMMTERQDARPDAPDTSAWGWYLYGIMRRAHVAEVTAALAPAEGEPLQALEQGELAAVLQPVPLEEFSAEALRARAEDVAWLEAMVREHNRIVAGIHQFSPVLPARFGVVYASRDGLRAALAERYDQLLELLQQLAGCDEWGVHLFADRQALHRLVEAHPALQRLKSELTTATPGRAYLLKRKLADELANITEEALDELARAGYARLGRVAVAGQLRPRPSASAEGSGEREVFHAILLVPREQRAAFLEEVQRLAEEQAELRCEYSGPWPPYSFASPVEEQTL